MSSEKVPSNIHIIHKFRSSCACAKYHQSFCSSFIHSLVSNDSFSGQWSPWSDSANAQAYLCLRCPHLPTRIHVFGWCVPYYNHRSLKLKYICMKVKKNHVRSHGTHVMDVFFDKNRKSTKSTFRIVVWLTRAESNIDTERYPYLFRTRLSKQHRTNRFKTHTPVYSLHTLVFLCVKQNPRNWLEIYFETFFFQQLYRSFLQFKQVRT